MTNNKNAFPTVTLGSGCFWCSEAILQRVAGIHKIIPGYMGGTTDHPSYREVCTENNGHIEVIQFQYDPTVITYEEILDWFWKIHDPTSQDRQGGDVGVQYRSIIFTHSDEQQQLAEQSRTQQNQSGNFIKPIVTRIEPAKTFWPAEIDHHSYYNLNPNAGYCQVVIAPKLRKLVPPKHH